MPESMTESETVSACDSVRTIDPPGAGPALVGRVAGVQQQIQDDLLELDAIAGHARQPCRELRFDDDPARARLTGHQPDDVGGHRVQVERKMRDRLCLQLREQVLGHLGEAPVAAADVGERGASLLDVRLRRAEELERGLGVRRRTHQRLIELVRDRAGQYAQ